MGAFSDTEFDLPPQRVKEILDAGEAELVDVREPYEWDAGRIPGATHIELERLAARADEVPTDKPIVFQCRLGVRSAMAMQAFRASGWDAYHLGGGIQGWMMGGGAPDTFPPEIEKLDAACCAGIRREHSGRRGFDQGHRRCIRGSRL